MANLAVVRHLEALCELVRGRLLLSVASWRSVLRDGDVSPESVGGTSAEAERIGRRVERAIRRVDRFVFGTTCIHRAVAARRMLYRRGVDARVAIGLRKRGDLEGHAWVELGGDPAAVRLFADDEGGYETVGAYEA